MEQENPYQSPVTAEYAGERQLTVLCHRLLDRRHASSQFRWLLRNAFNKTWETKLLTAGGAICLVGVSVAAPVGLKLFVAFVVGWLVSSWVRDLKWYRALGKQWAETEAVLDWQRIEQIAYPQTSKAAATTDESDTHSS